MTPLPRLARWLCRLVPMSREARAEVQADLHELFVERRRLRGSLHAHWRLCHDVASLWLQPRLMRRAGLRPETAGLARNTPLAFLRDARGDLAYAVRLFARQPVILVLTIAGLSLGLGIATAAFSIMNVAALRGEGLIDSSRAPGVLRTTERSVSTSWTYDEFLRLRQGATEMQIEAVLSEAAAVRTAPEDGPAPSAGVSFVSGGFFAATGGRVTLGRSLDESDESEIYRGGLPPVVVSFHFWSSRLNQDPAIVGRTIRIGRSDAVVVGVAERGFAVPTGRLLWMPLTAYGAVYRDTGAGAPLTVQVFGRLKPTVTLAAAEAQLGGVAASLPATATADDSRLRVRLDPHAGLGRVAASDMLTIALLVSAVIGLVLLLACANVATVLVSSAITREREMGVRAALGASRQRIVRQLITESLALGATAAAIGLLFAYWAMPTIGIMIEAPADVDLTPDLNVYIFLSVVTLLTGVGAGLAPAWHSRGADLLMPLKGNSAGPNRLAPKRLRSLLVVTQTAVSVLLIVMATLFVRATLSTAAIDVGFDPAGLYAVSAGLGDGAADDGAAIRRFWARAITEIQAIPGVASVALAELTPFGGATRTSITGEGPAQIITHFNRTRPEYFDTVGLRLLTGRTFTAQEIATTAPVAVVSQSLARAYWRDASPLGQALPPEIAGSSARPVIVGVVADAITAQLHERSTFAVYEPLDPNSERFAQLMIRVGPERAEQVEVLRSIDPQANVTITSIAFLLEQQSSRPRMLATLTGVLGIIAVALCAIGLYGLTASLVGQRSREMGVRVAMGARRGDLLRLLIWDSLRPVMLGLGAGVAIALLASRLVVAAMFFGVSPRDPIALLGASAILLAAALLAVLVPTRRAAAVDAAVVLRQS